MGKPKDGAVQCLGWNQNASSLESGEELAGIMVGNELVFYCWEAMTTNLMVSSYINLLSSIHLGASG